MKQKLIMMVCWAAVILFTAADPLPLVLNIDVSAKMFKDRLIAVEGDPGDISIETTVVSVNVHKIAGGVNDTNLVLELYAIGRLPETGELGVIDVRTEQIELTEENDYEARYYSPAYCIQSAEGKIKQHGEYITYLVVVSSPNGTGVDYRSGWTLRDKDVALIRKLRENARFDSRRRVVDQQGL